LSAWIRRVPHTLTCASSLGSSLPLFSLDPAVVGLPRSGGGGSRWHVRVANRGVTLALSARRVPECAGANCRSICARGCVAPLQGFFCVTGFFYLPCSYVIFVDADAPGC
jgi:hypothetical protein